jgi:PKD repeat protein
LDSAADTVAVNVTLNLPPVAVATGIPTTGDASLSVDFDASRSSDPESGSLIFYWDFGDPASGASNTSTLINPTHIYSDVGNHTAVVTVTDDFSNTDQASVEIEVTAPNMPPTVAPTATVDDFTVQFVANANDPEGDPLTYTWDFSDSTALSSDVNPTHIYNNPYTYTATVTVSDGEFDVSGDVIVSVFSSLEVDVFEANVNSGKKGKVKGKINLKAYVCFEGLPLPSDIIKVDCDGITLIEEPFGSFEEKVNKPGIFKYKEKNLYGKIDFSKSKIEVSRHKMLLNGFDNSNGVDVFISFGLSTGSDHILMKKKHGDDDSSDDDHRKRWYYKEKHHHANCDDMDPVPCPPNCQR